MTMLLVPEPAIPVLPQLAKIIGLNEAIVLQQLHFWTLRRGPWLDFPMEFWGKQFPFLSEATIGRTFRNLKDGNLIERVTDRQAAGGSTTRLRVLYANVPTYEIPGSQIDLPGTQIERPLKEERELREKDSPKGPSRGKPILQPHEEAEGFAQWLGYHCSRAERSVPRAGTSARSDLARTYAALSDDEGYSREDFELASDGVLGDPFMVENGHTKPENVLRKTKIAGRIDDGRKARDAAGATDLRAAKWDAFERDNAAAQGRAA